MLRVLADILELPNLIDVFKTIASDITGILLLLIELSLGVAFLTGIIITIWGFIEWKVDAIGIPDKGQKKVVNGIVLTIIASAFVGVFTTTIYSMYLT